MLHSDSRLIGDVRPENIFIGDDVNIKCSTMHTFYNDDLNFNKTFSTKEVTFLAQTDQLQSGKDQTSHPPTSNAFLSV